VRASASIKDFVRRLVGRLVGPLVGPSVGWLVSPLVGLLDSPLVGPYRAIRGEQSSAYAPGAESGILVRKNIFYQSERERQENAESWFAARFSDTTI
jgi:hypothetical protein